jgi:hypothetical protein
LQFRSLACFAIVIFASHKTISLGHAMVQASRQFKFPAIYPLIETHTASASSESSSAPTSLSVLNNVSDFASSSSALGGVPGANGLAASSAVTLTSLAPSSSSSSSSALTVQKPAPTVREIVLSVLRETPKVTLRLFRFYGILFLVIRPLIRMKNPFRNGPQVCDFRLLLFGGSFWLLVEICEFPQC